MSPKRQDQLALGSDAVFSLNVAVGLLPGDRQFWREFIVAEGLVITLGRRRLVVWRSVLEALERREARRRQAAARGRPRLPRTSL